MRTLDHLIKTPEPDITKPNLVGVRQLMKDYADQHGYLASFYSGGQGVPAQFILLPWKPDANEQARLMQAITEGLAGLYGMQANLEGPTFQDWGRQTFNVQLSGMYDIRIAVISRSH